MTLGNRTWLDTICCKIEMHSALGMKTDQELMKPRIDAGSSPGQV